MSIDNLLLVTDLAGWSDRALGRAVELAQRHNAALRILHVLDEDLPAEHLERLEKDTAHEIREGLSAVAHAQRLEVVIQVARGKGFPDILRLARQGPVDLVVLGARDSERVTDMFTGSTAERFLRHSDYPVLTVVNPAQSPYHHVLVVTDFSVSARRALELSLSLVPEGDYHLVHAYQAPTARRGDAQGGPPGGPDALAEEIGRRIQDEFGLLLDKYAYTGIEFQKEIVSGPALEAIRERVGQLQPDLLVMGTHGRTAVGQAPLGSVATRLLRDPPTDILAARAW
jgi:nucleotide-binding universal stress UspA family protein